MLPRGRLPYRGDGLSNVPRRAPLNESDKSSMRGFGCMVLVTGIGLVVLIFTTQNGVIGFIALMGILLLAIAYFAIRDVLGIKTITPDHHPVDKKDPAMLDDYIAQIEWKQTYRRNHPKEPKWRYHPKLAKQDDMDFRWFFTLLAAMLPPIILSSFFGVRSPVSIIGTLIYGLVGVATYLIYQDSRH